MPLQPEWQKWDLMKWFHTPRAAKEGLVIKGNREEIGQS